MNKNKFITGKADDDEFDEEPSSGSITPMLGYYKKSIVSTVIEVPIDEDIKAANYYRMVAQAIRNTSEEDTVQFMINSIGGRMDGLQTLLSSMWISSANTEAYILGECHSAASMLALNCNSIYVAPNASMLVHFIRFGSNGKGADVKSHVDHVYRTSEKLFRDTYRFFITDEEMEKILNGYEMWLDAEDIVKRLNMKLELQTERERIEMGEVPDDGSGGGDIPSSETPIVPKRKPKGPKNTFD